jgi:hypothetical protein
MLLWKKYPAKKSINEKSEPPALQAKWQNISYAFVKRALRRIGPAVWVCRSP